MGMEIDPTRCNIVITVTLKKTDGVSIYLREERPLSIVITLIVNIVFVSYSKG
jgi:hypothetical protein